MQGSGSAFTFCRSVSSCFSNADLDPDPASKTLKKLPPYEEFSLVEKKLIKDWSKETMELVQIYCINLNTVVTGTNFLAFY